MYQSPKLLRYGSFRDLTQAGWNGADDHLFFRNISGSNLWPGNTGGDQGTNDTRS